MNIEPMFTGDPNSKQDLSTTTNNQRSDVINNSINETILAREKRTLDPQGVIPNGIYRVFRHEKNIKRITIIIDFILALASIIIVLLFVFQPQLFNVKKVDEFKIPWGWYIVPVLLFLITFVNFISESIELLGILRSIVAYRESINSGSSSTPPFISILYRKLALKQVRRTWFVIAIIFYVGLFTLALWGLKDKTLGLLDFKKWISNAFPQENGANIVVYSLCGIMIAILVIFIINTIFRKKRMVDIESFFGISGINYNEIADRKSSAHKFYAKLFFLSILILLILPIVVYIILKKTVLKGK
ncbi:MSC_0882 family membrane protein [Mycoplasma phocoeninasale]|uniref:Uncharacterized protein n=1 Tax=Mycoplasma phocoeninasale TaxID=2726117 RepID=A0A858U070_9MOLU|nr:hypothetical protein [Mycoplasma phocoeninasale]MBN0970409.1 hypothetical protein [Mycoplasma phocoeninasale]QJG66464.1 hypothetical protein HGG64_01965 [Mycoplasma phocoeninasale]